MAIDPICGMTVDEAKAINQNLVIQKNGKEYYFCNTSCKENFATQKWYQTKTFSVIFPPVLGIVLTLGSILSIITDLMMLFMGLFFVVFALAKMMDLHGFAEAFSKYDIIAKQSNLYSSIYPGIEFFLGISYIFSYFLFNSAFVLVISFITFTIMTLGSIGILKNLFSKKPVQCACLGTKINLPLTNVTLLEDVIMSLMSLQLLRVILA